MSIPCTKCNETGFQNLHRIDKFYDGTRMTYKEIAEWILKNKNYNVSVCGCGNREEWYEIMTVCG